MHHKSNIADESLIYHPYGNLTTLREFSERIGIPLTVAKYRYAQHWDADWIIDAPCDNRFYEYKGVKYKLVELALLSNVSYSTL